MSMHRKSPDAVPSAGLETRMRVVSRVTSLLGFGLMAAGFAVSLVNGQVSSSLGEPALPLSALFRLWEVPLNLALMSMGIILLALLPMARVALALASYIRQREAPDIVASALVLVVLVVSILSGGD